MTISLLAITLVSAATMARTVPSTATVGSSFQVIYTVSGATTAWGASIIDDVSGGCLFPGSTAQLKTVMLSTDGNTKTITVTTPSNSGSCTFSGNFKFGTDAIVNFPTATTTISGTCTPSCSGKVCGDNGCGGSCGTCTSGQVCSNGQCISECPSGQTKCSDGVCKETCDIIICSEFFSDTMNWYAFSEDNDCANGYIMTGILVIGIILLVVFLKK